MIRLKKKHQPSSHTYDTAKKEPVLRIYNTVKKKEQVLRIYDTVKKKVIRIYDSATTEKEPVFRIIASLKTFMPHYHSIQYHVLHTDKRACSIHTEKSN